MTDWAKINYSLSNVNAILGSAVSYGKQKQSGVDTGGALMNFGLNVAYGGIRNEMAYDMSRHGNNLGFLVNNMAGYGTTESNMYATAGLFGASMFTPHSYGPFGGCMNSFGGNYMGGGYMGSPYGGNCMGPMNFGCSSYAPSMFMNMRFFC